MKILMTKHVFTILIGVFLGTGSVNADKINLHNFRQGDPANANEVNQNFQALKAKIEAQDKAIRQLQKQMQSILGQQTPGAPITPPILPTGAASEEADGFRFTMVGCSRNRSKVICKMKITSKGQDRGITVYAGIKHYSHSSMFDNTGFQYLPTNTRLGNTSSDRDKSLDRTLIAGIPTDLTFTFDQVSTQATYAAAIELKYIGGTSRKIKLIRLRNIPFDTIRLDTEQ